MIEVGRYFSGCVAILLRPEAVSSRPINIQLDPTSYCNLHCKMCIREDLPSNELNKHMTLADFKRIYMAIKPLSVNMAATGEPLLNPDFLQMVEYAKSINNSKIITSTNLTIVDRDLAKRIVGSGLDVLKVSIDAATSETYIKIRGRDYFTRILEGIQLLESQKKEIGGKTPQIRFDVVLQKDNYLEIQELIRLSKAIGVSHVFFRRLNVEGFSEARRTSLLDGFSTNHLLAELTEAHRLAKSLEVQTNLGLLIRNPSLIGIKYRDKTSSPSAGNTRQPICLLPWLQLFISVDGKTSPCCALTVVNKVNTGNIHERGFGQVWDGKEMQTLRKMFKEHRNYEAFEVCRQCDPMSLGTLFNWIRLIP